MTDHTHASLAEALADLQTQLPHIQKTKTAKVATKTGHDYKYTYADLAQISRELLPLLGKLGLSFTAKPTINADKEFVLAYRLRHVSGESDDGEYPLTRNRAPQETGSEITYARRYCLCAVTGIATDDDDDAAVAQAASRRSRRSDDDGREPGITTTQQRRMQELFRAAPTPVEDKDARLAYAIGAIGRQINSATEMTRAEAGKVIDKLESWITQNEPPA